MNQAVKYWTPKDRLEHGHPRVCKRTPQKAKQPRKTKLTQEIVDDIRAQLSWGLLHSDEIAYLAGVSPSTIKGIKRGYLWSRHNKRKAA